MDGASLLCQSLADQGVQYMFGVVGIPVIPIGMLAPGFGVKYYGLRNEQAASYAAQAVGYMTQMPGACLVVSGPGLVHALSGLANAQANCWPMILLGGSCETYLSGMGAFQESDQVEWARPYCKYAARIDSVDRIPFFVEKAVRTSLYGRPGPVYLDLPADIINAVSKEPKSVPRALPPPLSFADPAEINKAVGLIKNSKKPLVIVGKGAAYACAELECNAFVNATKLPYIPTPMGKGVIPDDHSQCVIAARTLALKNADLIILVGARLNWMLHFGLAPRFQNNLKVIQLDICAEESGNNVAADARLIGDCKPIMTQLRQGLGNWSFSPNSPWWGELLKKVEINKKTNAKLCADNSVPLTYYRALQAVHDATSSFDPIIVSEGANTMDIGRSLLLNKQPRHRLDAGTYGTMGVGLGFAIAAAAVFPEKKVVAVEGDSAFGFSGLELETACRYQLPMTIVIINNNGIYQGLDQLDPSYIPATALTTKARYEKIVEAFGGKGYCISQPEELKPVLTEALSQTVPTIVNIFINPSGQRKKQEFDWLTTGKTSAKL